MKTETVATVEPIWSNNDELLSTEECLPVIGSCQVSSIFQNLDGNGESQNMDLIILHTNECKIPIIEAPRNLQGNYIILKENTSSNDAKSKSKLEGNHPGNNFEDMLYYVCNLCPYLCTQDSKITEHLEKIHKSYENQPAPVMFKLKCPACSNIFYHRTSLRSHLTYDHRVSTTDLALIMQAVTYYAYKNISNKDEYKSESVDQSIKNNTEKEKNSKSVESPVEKENKEDENNGNNDDDDDTNDGDNSFEPEPEKNEQPQIINKVDLPQVDISQSNNFNNFMKKSEPNIKYVNSKKCPQSKCKVRLLDSAKLSYHTKCHSNGNLFSCPECKENFLFWKPLTSHLWRQHKIDMELFSCDKCEYKTYSLSKLNTIHKLIHGDVKAFACEVCSKAFKNAKQLRNHKVWHSEKVQMKSVTCSYCSKKFSNNRACNIHVDVVHKKIRQYLCSFCGYKGSSKAALQMHTRSHTGEKPFLCSECAYTTSDHNSLRRHKLRHSGEKPYKCIYCTYSCIQSTTYKVHMRTKHPGLEKGLMFTCPNCQFRTVNKDMYRSHMETIHKENVAESL